MNEKRFTTVELPKPTQWGIWYDGAYLSTYQVCILLNEYVDVKKENEQLKQFIDEVPNDLIEAAKLDGAGDFYIYTKIILPLIKPALVTVAILAFQTAWNNTETSNLYVNQEEYQTFAYYLSTLTNASNSISGAGVSAAAALIIFLPNLIIFIFLQSKVMDTMSHSGIK